MTAGGVFWIASYPKSGNTWVRCLIASLLSQGDAPDLNQLGTICPNGATRDWVEEVLGIPTDDLIPSELVEARIAAYHLWGGQWTGPRCLKVHDGYDPRLFPPEATAGVVYIARDPRDVAPSWGHHMDRTLDAAIEVMGRVDFTAGRSTTGRHPQTPQAFGSWSSHAASWLDGGAGPLLLLQYEALLADPLGQIPRLAAFLGIPADAQAIGRAASACGFDALRSNEEAAGFVERPKHANRFFRQGRAGAWRQGLSPAQAARLVADHGVMMARLGYSSTE